MALGGQQALLGSDGGTRVDRVRAHLNVPFREPLVPDLAREEALENLSGRKDDAPWVSVVSATRRAPTISATPRTLVLLGDLPDPAMSVEAVNFALAAGWPVIAEPFGAHDRSALVPHGPLLLTAGAG